MASGALLVVDVVAALVLLGVVDKGGGGAGFDDEDEVEAEGALAGILLFPFMALIRSHLYICTNNINDDMI